MPAAGPAPDAVAAEVSSPPASPPSPATLTADRFAIEPVCFRVEGGRLHSARRADLLSGERPELDPQALYDYLYFHVIPSPRTVFRGVYRLPPGHSVTLRDGAAVVTPSWVPEFKPDPQPRFESLRDEFRALLKAAVDSQWDGGKPGAYLSGGTDSSTVAGMLRGVAQERNGARAATFSIGFDVNGYDEMAYARLAAKHFDTEHHEYYVTPDDLVRGIPEVAAFYDQPFGNSSALPSYLCARMARAHGVTRILAGDGGDELFGGNSRYALQRILGLWDQTPAAARALLKPLLCNPLAAGLPLLKKGNGYIRKAEVPMPDRMQAFNLLEALGAGDVLEPAFLAQIDRQAPLAQQREVWRQARNAGPLDRQLAFDWRYTLAENDLPKVCGTAALAGLAVGFPMLDARLVDFSLRLPPSYKLNRLKLRWFFKEALRGFLPDEILRKKKQGFGLPFGTWAHGHAALNALARDALGSLGTRGLVKPSFIRHLLDVKLAEHPHYYGEMVWILTMLEHWLRHHAPDYRLRD